MDDTARSDATQILVDLRAGGEDRPQLTARLTELLYPELRRLAAGIMRRERASHTLQPTAVVHEAFVRLINQRTVEWEDRAHFLGIAARLMRQILIEHARKHRAAKRGSGADRVTLDDAMLPAEDRSFDLLALDEVLTRFAGIDPRAASVAELRIFGGLTVQETAHELGVSARTVNGDWTMARLWLARELSR
ncbi:MAG: ECF-type sigma factor [Vicinamibacterales bacterium]